MFVFMANWFSMQRNLLSAACLHPMVRNACNVDTRAFECARLILATINHSWKEIEIPIKLLKLWWHFALGKKACVSSVRRKFFFHNFNYLFVLQTIWNKLEFAKTDKILSALIRRKDYGNYIPWDIVQGYLVTDKNSEYVCIHFDLFNWN